jgi:hypothetical protein
MSDEKKVATPKFAKAVSEKAVLEDKVYEVVHAVGVSRDGKTVTVNRGGEIRRSEMSPGEAENLLASGVLMDPEAAVTGGTTDLAHDRLTSIALKMGLLTRKGAEYRFGEKSFKGVTAFRAGVSLDELEAAIVKEATAAPAPTLGTLMNPEPSAV